MASSSNQSTIVAPWALPVTEKLTRCNCNLWKAQVMPAIRGAQLEGLLDGSDVKPTKEIAVQVDGRTVKKPNEEYGKWIARDQQVVSYLLTSVPKDILTQVADKTTTAEVWGGIQEMLASQMRARAVTTRIALATTKKGNMSMDEYFTEMKSLADDMAAAGKPLDDDELVGNILTGLDHDYNPVVSAIVARVEPISVNELYNQLVSFDSHMDLLYGGTQSSANSASRGGRGGGRGNFRGRGGSRGGGSNQGNGARGGRNGSNKKFNSISNGGGSNKTRCQVCLKVGHGADECWHGFDPDYVPDTRNASAAINNYGVDSNWYTDTGATDHITGELNKLSVRDVYHGNDQIKTASGAGMTITHIGHATVPTPSKNLHLKNVLHIPNACKNLVSVHRLASDNNAFLEFHRDFFLIKDQVTKKTLLQGRCRGGLYPIPSGSKKQVLGAIKPSAERWHKRLGHPSF